MTRPSAYLLLQCQYRDSWQCYQTINGTTARTIDRYQKVLFFQLSFSFRTFLFKMAYTTQFMDSWFGIEIYRVVLTV